MIHTWFISPILKIAPSLINLSYISEHRVKTQADTSFHYSQLDPLLMPSVLAVSPLLLVCHMLAMPWYPPRQQMDDTWAATMPNTQTSVRHHYSNATTQQICIGACLKKEMLNCLRPYGLRSYIFSFLAVFEMTVTAARFVVSLK